MENHSFLYNASVMLSLMVTRGSIETGRGVSVGDWNRLRQAAPRERVFAELRGIEDCRGLF